MSTEHQADQAVEEYRSLFQLITEHKINSGVSIKVTQLGLDLGLGACVERLRTILKMAKQHDLFVRIDMEGSFYTQSTIDIFSQLLAEFRRRSRIAKLPASES